MKKAIKFAIAMVILCWCCFLVSLKYLGWFITSLIMVIVLFPTSIILSDVINFLIQGLPYSIYGISFFHIFLAIFSTLHIFLISLSGYYLVKKILLKNNDKY